MASSEKLQNEILLKEEAFLKEEKAKLTEQLNRLKVEERALVKLLYSDDDPPLQHTMQFFNQNLQSAEPSSLGQRINSGNFEVETEVNHIPLAGLDTKQIMQVDGEEEEEEEEDTDIEDMEEVEKQYSFGFMNAVSNLHGQDPVDHGLARSVLQSILQQEVGDSEGENEYF